MTMLSIHQIELFLQQFPLPQQEIALELRNIIACAAPDAAEVVRWGGLSYFHEGAGGIVSAGICQIGFHEDHVRLEIIHGVFIKDPKHLLIGDRKWKRYVRIESFEKAPWEYLTELISRAAKFDPRSAAQNPTVLINKKFLK